MKLFMIHFMKNQEILADSKFDETSYDKEYITDKQFKGVYNQQYCI